MGIIFEKRTLAATISVAVLVLGLILFFVFKGGNPPAPPVEPAAATLKQETIGFSVEGRKIEAYTYGTGETRLLLVGGIHGGYEWNSVILAYEFMDYLDQTSGTISKSLAVTVIPSANPDGVFKVIGKEGRFAIGGVPTSQSLQVSGRFNANKVDLNRNFDCRWKPEGVWRGNKVSAGSKAFSEPEAVAIRDFVLKIRPVAVVFWHSQANAVYASECEDGILPETRAILNTYSRAAGYPAVDSFDAYVVTGAAEDWLASIGIPAISVELKTHEAIEWEKNLAGIKALFTHYAK
ncbi:MAG: peptidase M14, carboxypeptidase A [Parcubacteria group bacterium Gr01-1014_20]|nr:MAG: peptidase M14, carboxypeptidase A [Parcubacteria group bacterium Gr01-1014_20]